MMRREAEPELMSSREQVIAYSEADFSKGEENFIHFIVNYLKNNQINLSNDDLIIDSNDEETLYKLIHKIYKMDKNELKKLGREARENIVCNFALSKTINNYQKVYRKILG